MIELIVILLASLNGTDVNSTDGCDYYGGANLRLDCERNYISNTTDDDYYCRENYYGGDETGLYDLLDRGYCD